MKDLLPSAPDATGFVLAGGQSSRMGRDKALLQFAGRPMIAHALSILSQAGLQAAIAGASPAASAALSKFASIIHDSAPSTGPLSGICAALAATSTRYAVFLPVDLPFLPASLLVFLLRHAQTINSAITVPIVADFAPTFPAVIDRAALPALQNELNSDRSGCFSAFQAASAALQQPFSTVAIEPLLASGRLSHPQGHPPADWFINLNTPADLARAEALYKAP